MNFLTSIILVAAFASANSQTLSAGSFSNRRSFRDQFDVEAYTYDLLGREFTQRSGGNIRGGDVGAFPVLDGEGLSYTLFTLEPCGINLPHVHPRAAELLYLISGENLVVSFIEENGGRTFTNTINAGMMTIFPLGLMHYQQNMGCEPAQYISALNSADPGVQTLTTNFINFPDEAILSSLNITRTEFELFENTFQIPAGPAKGNAECLQRCATVNARKMLRKQARMCLGDKK